MENKVQQKNEKFEPNVKLNGKRKKLQTRNEIEEEPERKFLTNERHVDWQGEKTSGSAAMTCDT